RRKPGPLFDRSAGRWIPAFAGNAIREALGKPHRAWAADLVEIEGGFPDRDLAVAHDPDLHPASGHRFSGDAVLPFAFPVIGDRVAHQRAQLLLEPVVLLPLAAAA